MHSTHNLNDDYIGSGKKLWYSINKYGRNNHVFEILEYLPDRNSLKNREKEIVNYDLLKDIVLFDVNQFKKGWVKPSDFIDNFNHLGIPRLMYHGNFNRSLINDVKTGVFDVKEGLVVKGLRRTKGDEIVWLTKIKTQWWLDKLKNKFGDKYLLKEVNYDKSLLER